MTTITTAHKRIHIPLHLCFQFCTEFYSNSVDLKIRRRAKSHKSKNSLHIFARFLFHLFFARLFLRPFYSTFYPRRFPRLLFFGFFSGSKSLRVMLKEYSVNYLNGFCLFIFSLSSIFLLFLEQIRP